MVANCKGRYNRILENNNSISDTENFQRVKKISVLAISVLISLLLTYAASIMLFFKNSILLLSLPAVLAQGDGYQGRCPFSFSSAYSNTYPTPSAAYDPTATEFSTKNVTAFSEALAALDFESVKADIITFLTTNNPAWPNDFGNYGPFMIRQAWHCAGTYRTSDGRGGCDGGRQRFNPERSWMDNANLDKAKMLLQPIKDKYGIGLSWGDLITFTG
jgi:hypothetical protein